MLRCEQGLLAGRCLSGSGSALVSPRPVSLSRRQCSRARQPTALARRRQDDDPPSRGEDRKEAQVDVLRSYDELALDSTTTRPAVPTPEWAKKLMAPWKALPGRYKVVFGTSLAFVICSMDKVNISIAIIPMAQDFGWSPTMSGLVQSAFFWGYMLSQIPGGYVTSTLGGRKTLPAGVGLWSAATAAVPVLAASSPGLMFVRAAVGLGEGVAPSSATDMIARVVSTEERSRAISFVFGGLHIGSLTGLLLCPALIDRFGWPSVFYLFGAVGVVWAIWWEATMADLHRDEPEVARQLGGQLVLAPGSEPMESHGGHAAGPLDPTATMPWRAFLRNQPIQILAFTHFCNNWFHYTMMAWLPTFFSETMNLDLGEAAHVSLLPPIASIVATTIVGSAADKLVESGYPVGRVRKIAQAIAFLGPATCLTAASLLSDSVDNNWTIALMTMGLGLASFSMGGLYSNHADLSPRYASFLLGLTNTTGAIPGIVGVTVTGFILDATGSWPLALFAPSICFHIIGTTVFSLFGSAQLQDFDRPEDNVPFWLEHKLEPFLARVRTLLPKKADKDE